MQKEKTANFLLKHYFCFSGLFISCDVTGTIIEKVSKDSYYSCQRSQF